MYINKLMINQFEDKGSAKKPNLVCVKHLVDDDSMNVKKLARLLDDLSDAWSCSYNDLQIQVRFVPQGTGDMDE